MSILQKQPDSIQSETSCKFKLLNIISKEMRDNQRQYTIALDQSNMARKNYFHGQVIAQQRILSLAQELLD